MRKALLLVVAALVAVPSSMAAGSPAPDLAPAPMFVGGGTFVSNGVFFPGTAANNDGSLVGVPYSIERGQDIELVNIDHGDVANCHQLTSFKRKRNGRPFFQSKRLCAPGEKALVLTSVVRPGTYEAFCPIHTGMYALIEIKS